MRVVVGIGVTHITSNEDFMLRVVDDFRYRGFAEEDRLFKNNTTFDQVWQYRLPILGLGTTHH